MNEQRRARPDVKFRDDEISHFQNKKTKEWHHHPHVGGRLRMAHDHEEAISIETRLDRFESRSLAVVQATLTLSFGRFNGWGTAEAQRDRDKVDALLELAETRAIARALRFAGYGVENAGAEEITRLEEGATAAVDPAKALATQQQVKDIFLLFATLDIEPAQQQAGLKTEGVKTVQELTQVQASALITKLQAKRDSKSS